MASVVKETNFQLPGQTAFYRGKVRDVYFLDDTLVMVVTDRVSAFDVILPKAIPYKGQVLNKIAEKFLDLTSDIVPNWKQAVPDPNVMVGLKCEPLPVEMIVRGYITGSAWRAYAGGRREISGVELPNGLRANQKFDKPIITPTTKAETGHDEEISREEIIKQGLVSEEVYEQIEQITYRLYERGVEYAEKRGLILVDTKYEFGLYNGQVYLIDEVHTPDSSRYWYKEDYERRFEQGVNPRQLSKEFVRQWLIKNDFIGQSDRKLPGLPDSFVEEVSQRYLELYEILIGEKFVPVEDGDAEERIYRNILKYLENKN